MDTPYNSTYEVGDRLRLELNTEQVFEGDYSDGGINRIDLINVRQHNNSNKLGGVYSFYRNEIIKIYKPKSTVIQKEEKSSVNPTDCNSIQIIEEEYNRLKEMCKNAIYIEQIDDTYFKSIENLSETETIGVVSLGSTKDSLSLLLMSTWRQVYIFDFTNKSFHEDIKNILQLEWILKVVHGGTPLINMLYLNYNINMQNRFDTQVVDLILEKSKQGTCPKTVTDISQCLVNNLNFPPSLLKEALSVPNKKWMERPLTEENKFFAAQHVVYLILLKEHMKKKLLCNIYKVVDDVHNVYCGLGNYEFSHLMQKNTITEQIGNLIPDNLI